VLNFSPEKLLLVGVIALIVLGPHRLPHAAKTLGRFMAHLRHLSDSFQQEMRGALDSVDSIKSTASNFRPPDLRQMVRDTVSTAFSAASPPPASSPPASAGPDPSSGPASMPVVPPAPDDPSLN
jgi:sec-independent protein translocase protein TatB